MVTLAYIDFNKKQKLYTNASDLSQGACQTQYVCDEVES